jgi:hypothetical protein
MIRRAAISPRSSPTAGNESFGGGSVAFRTTAGRASAHPVLHRIRPLGLGNQAKNPEYKQRHEYGRDRDFTPRVRSVRSLRPVVRARAPTGALTTPLVASSRSCWSRGTRRSVSPPAGAS